MPMRTMAATPTLHAVMHVQTMAETAPKFLPTSDNELARSDMTEDGEKHVMLYMSTE